MRRTRIFRFKICRSAFLHAPALMKMSASESESAILSWMFMPVTNAVCLTTNLLRIAVSADNYCLDHSVMKKNADLQKAFRRRLIRDFVGRCGRRNAQKRRAKFDSDGVKSNFNCPRTSAIILIFTARFFTRRMSVRCFVPTIR